MPRVKIPEGAKVFTAMVTYFVEEATSLKEEKEAARNSFDGVVTVKVVRERDREK